MLEAYLTFRADFAALDPERYPIEYFDHQIGAGLWRCWGNDKAAILAEIKVFPSGLKEVHGVAAAGDLQEIVDLIPFAEEWGRAAGCKGAEIESSPAWGRLLAKHGYRITHARAWKEL